MPALVRVMLIGIASLALAGCTHTWSRPLDPAFAVEAHTASVFVDRDGSVYPPDWPLRYGPQSADRVARTASLRRGLDAVQLRTFESEQAALLDQVAAMAQAHERVFILVHGFRDPQPGPGHAFRTVMQAIDLQPTDAVIGFHWDGLQSNEAGIGNIWFESTGNSQLAGLRALRPLLARLQGKRVILISFSRGASVILSAFGDPAFDETRERQELQAFPTLPLTGASLPANGNRFDVIFLAPAVGCPDFWKPRREWRAGEPMLRPLPLIRSLQYTTNPDDPALMKAVRALPSLSGRFNATNLGYVPAVGETLRQTYPVMDGHAISGIGHSFVDYAAHPVLRTMLERIDVQTRPLPFIQDYAYRPPVNSPGVCQTVAR